MKFAWLVLAGSLAFTRFAGSVSAETPPPTPLSDDQRGQMVRELVGEVQAEEARLKGELDAAERKLAAVYGVYDLDAESAAQLEAEILDLQQQLLANYRRMQTELRNLVSEERFANLKRRLDNLLMTTSAEREQPARPRRDANQAATNPDAMHRDQSPATAGPPVDSVDQVFSGPQAGEKLPSLTVRGVFDGEAGEELAFVSDDGAQPIVLVFVHEANRPSIGFTRALTSYTRERTKDGLATGIVWLDDDPTEAEAALKRMRHALPPGVPIGISLDGKEGPGSYGLNRNVTLTILVADRGRVTANFALVQPSMQVDLPKVFDEIVQIIGGEPPKLAEADGQRGAMREPAAPELDPRLQQLIRSMIQPDATQESVDQAAAAVEAHLERNQAARTEVGRIATTVVGSGKLSNYGTPQAQHYLQKWAERYGAGSRDAADTQLDRKQSEAPSR